MSISSPAAAFCSYNGTHIKFLSTKDKVSADVDAFLFHLDAPREIRDELILKFNSLDLASGFRFDERQEKRTVVYASFPNEYADVGTKPFEEAFQSLLNIEKEKGSWRR